MPKPSSGWSTPTKPAKVWQAELPAAILAAHGRVKPVLEERGIPYPTYRRWMQTVPDFHARVMSAKAQAGIGSRGTTPGITFEAHRFKYFQRKTYPHQMKLASILDSVKPREIVLVLIHPEAGKTATIEDWLCKKIGENPDIRITYLGESKDLATKVLGYIKGRMTEPEWLDYQTDYGPFHIDGQEKEGKPWTTSYITVARASHAERDYTIQCRAITSRAYGSRIDLLIGDDIQSRETYGQTDKILTHLRQTYFTRGKKMTMVFVGTRIGPGDVYEKLIEGNLIDRLIEIPAATGDVPRVPEAWADPDDYDTDEEFQEAAKTNLARIRHQVGEDVWWSSYQQQPRTNQLASFTSEMIDAARDWDRPIRRADPGSLVYLSLDPALGGMNALLAARYHPDKMELLDLQTDTGFSQSEQIMERIRVFAQTYRPAGVIIEKNAFQRGLANDHRLAAMGRELGFWVKPHETGTEKNDPILGVAAMAGAFTASEIRIPSGDPTALERFKDLTDQLDAWRPNVPTRLIRQDTVMALWFNWKHWQAWRQALARQAPPVKAWRPTWVRREPARR